MRRRSLIHVPLAYENHFGVQNVVRSGLSGLSWALISFVVLRIGAISLPARVLRVGATVSNLRWGFGNGALPRTSGKMIAPRAIR
jgi:hypothetical protein